MSILRVRPSTDQVLCVLPTGERIVVVHHLEVDRERWRIQALFTADVMRSRSHDLNLGSLTYALNLQHTREPFATFLDRLLPVAKRLIGDTRKDRRLVALRQEEEMVLDVMLQRCSHVRE